MATTTGEIWPRASTGNHNGIL